MPFKPHFAWDLLSREEINNRTVRALNNYLSFLKDNSLYYAEILDSEEPDPLTSIEDISKFPVTTIEDIQSSFEDFVTVDDSVITESFLLKSNTILPMTNSDLDRIAYDTSLFFHAMGLNENSKVAIVLDHNSDLSSTMAIYRGLTAIGANTLRASSSQREQLSMFNPSTIIGTYDTVKKLVAETPLSSLETLCFVDYDNPHYKGEENPELEEYTLYSLLYIEQLSTSFGECSAHEGLHNHPELTVVEILDEDNNPLDEGEEGFLTVTPFGITGFPLLRYKSTIRAKKICEKCSCGKNSIRIVPIIIEREIEEEVVQETVVDKSEPEVELTYTEQVKAALLELDIPNFIIEFKGKKDSDDLHVHAQVKPAEVGKIMALLRGKLNRTIPVLVSNRPTIQAMKEQCCDDEGYFIDNRL